MIKSFTAILAAMIISAANIAVAESRYITDITYVPIRSGPGNEFRILHSGLKSGTKMTLLEAPEDSDWTKVVTEGGIEGWVRSQYLISTPTARLVLIETQSKLQQTEKKLSQLQTELNELQSEHRTLSNLSVKQVKERDQYAEELHKLKTLAADSINLNQRYQELLAKHEMMNTEFDAVQAENDRLKSDKTISQWLFGAGLLITGMILMIILPALRPKKRNSDWAD